MAGPGVMYDAITPANIPADATEVAGYGDGRYKWSAADWARFTQATLKLVITAIPMNLNADVCDCETGDYTPAQAAQWAQGRMAMGKRPVIYCNLGTQNTVVWELSVLGISMGQVDWWIAHYTQVPHLEPGSQATQYADPGPVDISETAPGWTADQGSAPSSPTSPLLPTSQEMQMFSFCVALDGVRKDAVWVNPDGTVSHGWSLSGNLIKFDGVENLGGGARGATCSWEKNGNFTVAVHGTDDHVYLKVSNGSQWVTDWTQTPIVLHSPAVGPQGPAGAPGAAVRGPQGPQGAQGPAGPAYDDTAIKAEVADIQARVAKVAADLVPAPAPISPV